MNEEDNKRLGLLIFALARGDVSVLEDIYLLMVKILYAIGNIYFNQKADIEDVIQDFLILLYEKAGKFKHSKSKRRKKTSRTGRIRIKTYSPFLNMLYHISPLCDILRKNTKER